MSATIIEDAVTTMMRFMSSIMTTENRLVSAKIVVNGVEQDLMAHGLMTQYDTPTQPTQSRVFRLAFFGIFTVTQPNSTIDEISLEVDMYCFPNIRHRIIRNVPITLDEGIYGIVIALEYIPQQSVPITVR